jgi:hypothetical protein
MGGAGQLDGEHIKQFLKTMSIFPVGSLVRLTNGRVAKVVAPNPTEFTKPIVSLLTNEEGMVLPKASMAQLDLFAVRRKNRGGLAQPVDCPSRAGRVLRSRRRE